MSISMHSASVPVFRQMLTNLLAWLDKAQAYAETRKFKSDNYLGLRLAGVENPKYEDNEATLDELRARIRKTLEFMQSVPADKVDGSEEREIVVPLRNGELKFTGERYLKHYAMPNFYFHCTTAYALLRHAGVDIGKVDYIGAAG